MKILTGGDLVVQCLADQGVQYVFSIIGGQMGTMYDAIGKHPAMDVVTPRSETSTAIMACGYTATTGRPAVSMATVGAGVVYEVAGLLKAWLGYLPIVSIAPQVQSHKMKPHQENLQACEQDELFEPITKFNAIVYHWQRIPQLVNRAFREATAGIPGPVHLDIPVDVLFKHRIMTPQRKRQMMVPPARSRYTGPIRGDEQSVEAAAQALASAKKPLVVLGQGMGGPWRHPQVKDYLNRMEIPVIATRFSGGALHGGDACFAGDASLFLESGEKILAEADLVLVLGTDPESQALLGLAGAPSERTPVVQVETDPAALSRQQGVFPVYADPASALEMLEKALAAAKGRRPAAWKKKALAAGERIAQDKLKQAGEKLQAAFALLEEDSIKDTLFIADGEPAAFASAFLRNKTHKGLYVMDQDDMAGAGLPFAIGAALGNRNQSIILVCDKESLFHHLRELQPAVAMEIGITLLCVDQTPDADNGADLAMVLEGLGCHVHRAGEKVGVGNFLRHKGQPGAILC